MTSVSAEPLAHRRGTAGFRRVSVPRRASRWPGCYLGFRLLAPPFTLSHAPGSPIFVVYLTGSASSAVAGRLVDSLGRPRMLWVTALTLVGVALMVPAKPTAVVAGLVVTTAGFFAAHATASGWVGARAAILGVQGPAVYLCCYYLGSSIGGWLGGFVFAAAGWPGITGYVGAFMVAVLVLALSLRSLRRPIGAAIQ